MDHSEEKKTSTEESRDVNQFCQILHEVLQEFVLIINILRELDDAQTAANSSYQTDVLPFLKTVDDNVKRLENNINLIEKTTTENSVLVDQLRKLVDNINSTLVDREHGLYAVHTTQTNFNRDITAALGAITAALLNDTTGWGVHVKATSKIEKLVEAIDKKLFRFFTLLGIGASITGLYNFLHWLKEFLQ